LTQLMLIARKLACVSSQHR